MDQFKYQLMQIGLTLDNVDLYHFTELLGKYEEYTSRISSAIFERLNPEDQEIFLQWFLQRWGKISVVPADVLESYHAAVERFKNAEKVAVSMNGNDYCRVNFADQGADFDLIQYDWVLGIHDIYFNQYEHGPVRIERGQTIIDAGAFIGDTAVLFSHKAAGECSVHSFELLDENIALIHENLSLNEKVAGNVRVNKLALSDVHGGSLWIETKGTQGATKASDGGSGGQEEIQTTTIDHYVKTEALDRIDFIKMDIEGGEVPALRGAKETIERFRPNLAICLYHIWDDPFTIPELINSFDVEYEFGFKWVNLQDGWEAVLFANPVEVGGGRASEKGPSPAQSNDVLESMISHVGEAFGKKFRQANALWQQQNSSDR